MIHKIYSNLSAIIRVYTSRLILVLWDEISRVHRAPVLARQLGVKTIPVMLPTEGHSQNCGIVRNGNEWIFVTRVVNYRLTPLLKRIQAPNGKQSIDSRSWLARLDDQWKVLTAMQLNDAAWRITGSPATNGLEDPRIFFWNGSLWGSWNACHIASDSWDNVSNIMTIAQISGANIVDLRYLPSPHGRLREKNWIPWVIPSREEEEELRFVYDIATLETYRVTPDGLTQIYKSTKPHPMLQQYSGGSPLIPYRNGFLCAVHYAARVLRIATGKLGRFFYLNRFVYISKDFEIKNVSEEFFLEHKGTEFCAGLAIHGDSLVLSYSVRDIESRILSIDIALLDKLLSLTE